MVRLIQFYSPRGLKLSRAENQYVWDFDGRKYIDCHTQYGSLFLGHRNPRIITAIKDQLDKIYGAYPAFDTEAKEKALESLSKILPRKLEYVYMLNGGGEAVELSLKTARKLTGRKKFISFINAFHGRTMGALSVTWNPKYREGYDPFPWDVRFLPYNKVEEVEREVDNETAGVIVEVIQGEGGLNEASIEFLKAIREACDRTGAQMIIDEVQTGFGRTGYLWAHQIANIEPDILVAGKAIGGGFPVSLAAIKSELGEKLKEGDHGSTFGVNPLACSALTASIQVLLEENVVEKTASIGRVFRESLESIKEEFGEVVREVKGRGLMLGIETRFEPTPILKLLQDNGVIALRAGRLVLRFLPPYMITLQDIQHITEALKRALSQVKEEKITAKTSS
ncbi:MAG: aspartate aminotransferase family protein [Thaumarchaeota archaeon]|jgi:acetylornithine/LysW-gamma-L-lysine aminotransferase|nr:aspartate aminotransferase family protein [Candidatus Geocrenenecus arthurdayi]MCL7388466.1 aspartate aminotransferase family protein [Candidatus Geocrenenecus arthurdayi]MCL7390833.1 aspartate aminotransferase family protein [Candidatus Geocrenenecus arthurdayi]MCL7396201.1 aspartate aminotransferase family protein [Candidatus Geocrenenecus arthurdayi]MCL7403078.1 aspartate aminotransferase family protein [Candidatus Geocrenenecus arthurdayi]